jgi:muramidase (phage lysozyme)
VACIKGHESGDYGERSHPSDGSGAYQFIPGTWRYYAGRAGFGGYALAYQAPPDVQDAVLAYALTHGGAGSWSMKFGNDPCTAGLPGGG